MGQMTLLQGDCLELMKDIPDGGVDLLFTDLPFGTTKCKWDTPLIWIGFGSWPGE